MTERSEPAAEEKKGLRTRDCSVCGRNFKGRSRKCEKCSRKSSLCTICGKATNSRTAKKCSDCKPKVCQICGSDLPAMGKSKYCGSSCAERGKSRTPKSCLVCGNSTDSRDQSICIDCRTKKCKKCNEVFTPQSSKIIYCSVKCRNLDNSTIHRGNKYPNTIGIDMNIIAGGVEMRWCKGHNKYHLSSSFPKDKYICKQWRSAEGKKSYAASSESENFMQGRRDRRLFLAHGLTPAGVLEILEEQNFSCLVCGTNDSGTRPWNIDHDHNCCPPGKSCQKCRRGILCFKCNSGLGCLKDSIPVLKEAIQVITNFRFNIFPSRKLAPRKRAKHSLVIQKDFATSYHLKYAYSVDLEELLALVGNPIECLICKNKSPGSMSWNVDHDHKCCPGNKSCGKCIRGILCHLCNKGIGLLGDDPLLLSSAVLYLERFQNVAKT